jgi:hypothetical protein
VSGGFFPVPVPVPVPVPERRVVALGNGNGYVYGQRGSATCGLLEETRVVAMGEFGRTPRIGQITSDAGADAGGRDHWTHCYTVLFAGGRDRGRRHPRRERGGRR